MKNNITNRIYAVIAVVIIIVVIIIATRSGGSSVTVDNNASTTPVVLQATTTSVAVNNVKAVTQPAPTKTVPKVTTPVTTQTGNYANDRTQLAVNSNKCDASALSQYNTLYAGTLEGSSYKSYYIASTGACYMTAKGNKRAPYAATTTSLIDFRNVNQASIIASCVDPIGLTFGDSEWKCTDKASGQALTLSQFNALLYKYTAQ